MQCDLQAAADLQRRIDLGAVDESLGDDVVGMQAASTGNDHRRLAAARRREGSDGCERLVDGRVWLVRSDVEISDEGGDPSNVRGGTLLGAARVNAGIGIPTPRCHLERVASRAIDVPDGEEP